MNAKVQLQQLGQICGPESFKARLQLSDHYPLKPSRLEIFQINVGKKCSLSCKHCHVEAGPERTEVMSKEVFEKCLNAITRTPSFTTIDITGGAPELNPHLEWFLSAAAGLHKRLILRSNLVILQDEPYKKYIDIYARNFVEVVGSLPDYHQEKTDRVRGEKSFERCIRSLRDLNAKGYGTEGSGLILDLMHNPVGSYMPGLQASLEHEYRQVLAKEYGVSFNRLFSLTNMPIGRYLQYLVRTENIYDYMNELVQAYNPAAVPNVMCKFMISVAWDGRLYDCDFNQMLELEIEDATINTIDRFDPAKLAGREIITHNHCYGCTAGSGSSCQGATS